MSLLVLTSVCAMVAAAGGAPAPLPLAALLVGGALACGGASALNHVLDRDIDRLMGPRTASRPVSAGRIAPAHAAAFGLTLSALSFLVLAVFANLLAAAHGSIGLGAAFLFLIVLLWTPPHFWALALLLAPHYEAAGVPMMMPVVRGTSATTARTLLYTLALVAATIAPVLTGTFGVVYLAGAGVLDGVLCALAWRVRRESTPRRAGVLFQPRTSRAGPSSVVYDLHQVLWACCLVQTRSTGSDLEHRACLGGDLTHTRNHAGGCGTKCGL